MEGVIDVKLKYGEVGEPNSTAGTRCHALVVNLGSRCLEGGEESEYSLETR